MPVVVVVSGLLLLLLAGVMSHQLGLVVTPSSWRCASSGQRRRCLPLGGRREASHAAATPEEASKRHLTRTKRNGPRRSLVSNNNKSFSSAPMVLPLGSPSGPYETLADALESLVGSATAVARHEWQHKVHFDAAAEDPAVDADDAARQQQFAATDARALRMPDPIEVENDARYSEAAVEYASTAAWLKTWLPQVQLQFHNQGHTMLGDGHHPHRQERTMRRQKKELCLVVPANSMREPHHSELLAAVGSWYAEVPLVVIATEHAAVIASVKEAWDAQEAAKSGSGSGTSPNQQRGWVSLLMTGMAEWRDLYRRQIFSRRKLRAIGIKPGTLRRGGEFTLPVLAFLADHVRTSSATSPLAQCGWFMKVDTDTLASPAALQAQLRQLLWLGRHPPGGPAERRASDRPSLRQAYLGSSFTFCSTGSNYSHPVRCTDYHLGGPGYVVSRNVLARLDMAGCLADGARDPIWNVHDDVGLGYCLSRYLRPEPLAAERGRLAKNIVGDTFPPPALMSLDPTPSQESSVRMSELVSSGYASDAAHLQRFVEAAAENVAVELDSVLREYTQLVTGVDDDTDNKLLAATSDLVKAGGAHRGKQTASKLPKKALAARESRLRRAAGEGGRNDAAAAEVVLQSVLPWLEGHMGCLLCLQTLHPVRHPMLRLIHRWIADLRRAYDAAVVALRPEEDTARSKDEGAAATNEDEVAAPPWFRYCQQLTAKVEATLMQSSAKERRRAKREGRALSSECTLRLMSGRPPFVGFGWVVPKSMVAVLSEWVA